MRTPLIWLCTLTIQLLAAETPPALPLWEGRETIESYAARVSLPAGKSFDLGNGVTLDLALIPAGQFVMGSAEPSKPTLTVRDANTMIWIGAGLVAILCAALAVVCIRKRRLSFSLRWLLAMTAACGVVAGGFARRHLAFKQIEKYDAATVLHKQLPRNETIAAPFYMGKFTVTQAQWEAVSGPHGSHFKGAQLPVECVTYDEAQKFCRELKSKLGAQGLLNGWNIQIPTEVQWEYACRAGTTTAFYTGDTLSSDDANFDATKPSPYLRSPGIKRGKSMPVGSFKPNAFGLYDMLGNVRQWCSDGRAYKDFKNVRGANWSYGASECRAPFHSGLFNLDSTAYVGFRIIVIAPETRK